MHQSGHDGQFFSSSSPPDGIGLRGAPRHSPTVKRRHLSRALRELRETRGHTADWVTKRLEWSTGKLSGIENNKWKRPNPRDIRDLCELYETDQETCDTLMQLARDSRKRGWWEDYNDVYGSIYIGFEQEARRMRVYQPLVIPGLLQTPAYMRELMRAALIRGSEVERRVEIRLQRQKALSHEDPLRVWAVIDEGALRRPFGSTKDQREQLARLIETEDSDSVTVQILPFSKGLHAGHGASFVILDYQEDPSLVYIEVGARTLYVESEEDLDYYDERFQHLQATALSPAESIRFLHDMSALL
ncbi:helix-turn-helix transcriptional regulator [Actinocorallia sp. A-T 12471]|uniref:helix-turn-helix domain-containing protein n=1 Tax=Actinocorallia sp. A-T 12471 TaxID=3089813 RepID=UPI0029CEBE72|nr:helix-turn-helix transcriptional regulator [Actinocorallia sp. A-T 12471]MDX6741754.1 helix-turn-helix transcriptional regulator [Actinocorallia sp. A-T 12471]